MAHGNSDRARETIRARLADMGISAREASRRAGFNVGYLGDFLEGRSRTMESDRMAKVCEVLNLSFAELAGQLAGSQRTPQTNRQDIGGHNGTLVPLLSVEGSTSESLMPLMVQPAGFVQSIPALEHIAGAYAFTIANSSNEPRYLPGEVIYISPVATPRIGDFVFIRLKDGRGGPTQLTKMDDNRITVRPLQGKKAQSFAKAEVVSVHRIVASVG